IGALRAPMFQSDVQPFDRNRSITFKFATLFEKSEQVWLYESSDLVSQAVGGRVRQNKTHCLNSWLEALAKPVHLL
ncbi:MAG: hypothetical protein ACOYKC_09995, partial [Anaerolineaceae bacterium]